MRLWPIKRSEQSVVVSPVPSSGCSVCWKMLEAGCGCQLPDAWAWGHLAVCCNQRSYFVGAYVCLPYSRGFVEACGRCTLCFRLEVLSLGILTSCL